MLKQFLEKEQLQVKFDPAKYLLVNLRYPLNDEKAGQIVFLEAPPFP